MYAECNDGENKQAGKMKITKRWVSGFFSDVRWFWRLVPVSESPGCLLPGGGAGVQTPPS